MLSVLFLTVDPCSREIYESIASYYVVLEKKSNYPTAIFDRNSNSKYIDKMPDPSKTCWGLIVSQMITLDQLKSLPLKKESFPANKRKK